MDLMDVRREMMGVIARMAGGSSYNKIYSGEITANVDSTSPIALTSIDLGSSAYTSGKILYARIRDKAGKRNGYYYGEDCFLINYLPKAGLSSTVSSVSRSLYYHNNDITYQKFDSFGIYINDMSSSGLLRINGRYSSANTLTINGTFTIDVYLLDWPNDISPFN